MNLIYLIAFASSFILCCLAEIRHFVDQSIDCLDQISSLMQEVLYIKQQLALNKTEFAQNQYLLRNKYLNVFKSCRLDIVQLKIYNIKEKDLNACLNSYYEIQETIENMKFEYNANGFKFAYYVAHFEELILKNKQCFKIQEKIVFSIFDLFFNEGKIDIADCQKLVQQSFIKLNKMREDNMRYQQNQISLNDLINSGLRAYDMLQKATEACNIKPLQMTRIHNFTDIKKCINYTFDFFQEDNQIYFKSIKGLIVDALAGFKKLQQSFKEISVCDNFPYFQNIVIHIYDKHKDLLKFTER